MDLLADVLSQAGLQRRILKQRAFTQSMALEFPCAKSFGFHVVTQGIGFIHTPGNTSPLSLHKGDVAFMARGFTHVVSTEAVLPSEVLSMAGDVAPSVVTPSSTAPKLTLVSGAYQVWNEPVHPLFAQLPQWYVLRSQDAQGFDQLQMSIHLLASEVSEPSYGSATATQALLDVIFTYIIRKIIRAQDAQPHTWGFAVNLLPIRQALELMHEQYARAWTLDELAKHVGVSRAGFAQKFREALGATPFHYLTTIRIQKAMELLTTRDDKIEAVAEAVGYKDAFTFSKAFKKVAGMPPRAFRQKDLSERDDKWRFRA